MRSGVPLPLGVAAAGAREAADNVEYATARAPAEAAPEPSVVLPVPPVIPSEPKTLLPVPHTVLQVVPEPEPEPTVMPMPALLRSEGNGLPSGHTYSAMQ